VLSLRDTLSTPTPENQEYMQVLRYTNGQKYGAFGGPGGGDSRVATLAWASGCCLRSSASPILQKLRGI
jgi:hypothetical protein